MKENRRILIIDDDEGIRETYQDILVADMPLNNPLLIKGKALFGSDNLDDTHKSSPIETYDVILAENGLEGVAAAQKAVDENVPFAAAFIDMKMPGMDGAQTAKEIWGIDPSIKIIIVTAYSEYTPEDIIEVTKRENIFYLRKPFNHEEILQFARALSKEWNIQKKRDTLQKELKQINGNLEEKIKQQAAMIVQAEKMASIGLLAAGVAHEINNPITFINANLSALKKYLDKIFRLNKLYEDMADSAKNVGAEYMPDILQSIDAFKRDNKTVFIMGDIETLMDETISGVDRIKNIIQELKIFSRKDDADFKIADVNEIIMGTLKIVGSQLKQKATVTMDLQPLPKVHCFPIKISQVLINLLINASQAIEQNGDIGILTDLVTDGRKNIAEFVRIRVTDTGMGIPESHMASLFDPFFTTKQVGVGTGLGLSVAYEIITSHNGQIQVDSKMDQGSCFTILLPIHNNDAIRMN